MRQGFEGILRKLERAAGMPAGGVVFEYLHNAAGADFTCGQGPVEGTIPALASLCDGEGFLVLAGRPAYDLLASGARGEDRVAFLLAHELVHIKERHGEARAAKIAELHQQWVDRRLAFFREQRREHAEQVERMSRGWSGDDGWWQWFYRDLYGRDPARESPQDPFLVADKAVAQWLQGQFNMLISRQEHQADADGCKIMSCARYNPLEGSQGVFPLGHLLWWHTGEREDPRAYGSSTGRARELFHEALAGRCDCPNPPAAEEAAAARPAPPRSSR